MSTLCTVRRFCIAIGLSWLGFGQTFLPAQQPTDLASTALAIAPQDSAFFMTSIGMKQSWEQFVQGSFVSSLRKVSYVRALEQEIANQWANPQGEMRQVKATLQNPSVRDLLRLGADMLSQEFFVYGDGKWCETIEGLIQFQTEMMATIQEDPQAIVTFFNELTREDIDSIRIPTTVIGFRLSEDGNARSQLDQLEGILRIGGGQMKELAPFLEKLKRKDLKDGQTLTITLDTTLIPLEQVDEDERATVERVVELFEGRSLSLTLGVKANMLLIALGEGTDLLEGLGAAEGDRLLDHQSLEVLKQADLKELRSVAFASERWRQSQWKANFGNYFKNLSMQFGIALDAASEEIPEAEQWKDDIGEGAQWLDNKLLEMAPMYGDMLAWSRAIPGGVEGWAYDWSQNVFLKNSSPMQILQHAGAKPILMLGMKQAELPVLEEICDYVMENAPEHVRRFIHAAEQDEEERALALKAFDRAWPLVEQAAEILRDQIAPALDDRETVFSLAASWTTRDLGPSLPAAEEPVSLPELAIACRLNDREQFIEGCVELYEVFDRAVELVREISPDAVPAGYAIPRPMEEMIGEATSYSYAELSEAVGLDGFKPQLIVSDKALVIGYSDRQVRDMIKAKPLTTRPAWLTDEAPVAAVSYVDYAGFFSAARSWIQYAMALNDVPLDEPIFPGTGPVPTGNDILQIWDCFSSAGIAAGTSTIDNDGPNISRWVWVGR